MNRLGLLSMTTECITAPSLARRASTRMRMGLVGLNLTRGITSAVDAKGTVTAKHY